MNHQHFKTTLPADWTIIEEINDTVKVGELEIFISGHCAQNKVTNQMAVGSQASATEARAEIAYYELLERISTIEYFAKSDDDFCAPWMQQYLSENTDEFQISKSNGISFHSDKDIAKRSATCELLERHVVLNSWYGDKAPRLLNCNPSASFEKIKSCYDCHYYEIPNDCELFVVMITLTPLEKGKPFIFGFGAHPSLAQAIEKSENETIQRLGFLYHEEIEENPQFSASPFYHQEIYLGKSGQQKIQTWINGDHVNPIFDFHPTFDSFQHIDITPEWLKDKYVVVKAVGENYVPLYFGKFLAETTNYLIHPIA